MNHPETDAGGIVPDIELPDGSGRLVVGIVLAVLGPLVTIAGITAIVAFYLSQGRFPLEGGGNWNVAFGLVGVLLGLPLIALGFFQIARGRREQRTYLAVLASHLPYR